LISSPVTIYDEKDKSLFMFYEFYNDECYLLKSLDLVDLSGFWHVLRFG